MLLCITKSKYYIIFIFLANIIISNNNIIIFKYINYLSKYAMMKRKVVQQGPCTHMISLPAKWIRLNSIKKGDELHVIEKGSSLFITPSENGDSAREISVNYESFSQFPKRLFVSPYVRGYDTIRLNFKDPSVIDSVEKSMFMLTGFEIVEQKEGSITLQNIVKIDSSTFDQVYERIFNIAVSMLQELADVFRSGDFSNLQGIIKYESLMNKLDLYCRRILNMYGYKERDLTNSIYSIIRNLESMSDIMRDMIKEMEVKEKNNAACIGMTILIELLKLNQKVLFTHNRALISEIKEKEQEYLKAIEKSNEAINPYLLALFYPVHHISEEVL